MKKHSAMCIKCNTETEFLRFSGRKFKCDKCGNRNSDGRQFILSDSYWDKIDYPECYQKDDW